ncbi:MAG: hypothetical protein WB773_04045, partial [Isosphaeraceae bacterium]
FDSVLPEGAKGATQVPLVPESGWSPPHSVLVEFTCVVTPWPTSSGVVAGAGLKFTLPGQL